MPSELEGKVIRIFHLTRHGGGVSSVYVCAPNMRACVCVCVCSLAACPEELFGQ